MLQLAAPGVWVLGSPCKRSPAFGQVRKRDKVWLTFEKKLVPTPIDPSSGGWARGAQTKGRGVGVNAKRGGGKGECVASEGEEFQVGMGVGGAGGRAAVTGDGVALEPFASVACGLCVFCVKPKPKAKTQGLNPKPKHTA